MQFGVGLVNPKFPQNVGAVIRATYAFGGQYVYIQGLRYQHSKTDTAKATRHIPVSNVENILNVVPIGAEIVCCEINDKSISLPRFHHPKSAFYVFGPEDSSIPDSILNQAKYVVTIPTTICLNLAGAVNVVLYDRISKNKSK